MLSEVEPLDGDVRALLDSFDRIEARADAAIVARMRDRIEIALVAGDAMEPAVRAPRAKPPAPSALRRALSFAGSFAAGAIVALAGERLLAPASPAASVPPVHVLAPASPVAPPTSSAPDAPLSASPAPSDPPNERRIGSPPRNPAPARSTPPTREEARDEELSAEARLVDTARSALAHGDFASALSGTKNHERRFPEGRLAEEREAIMIQALAGAHQDAESRRRADAFRRRYPQSFFLPLVNRAVSSAQ